MINSVDRHGCLRDIDILTDVLPRTEFQPERFSRFLCLLRAVIERLASVMHGLFLYLERDALDVVLLVLRREHLVDFHPIDGVLLLQVIQIFDGEVIELPRHPEPPVQLDSLLVGQIESYLP